VPDPAAGFRSNYLGEAVHKGVSHPGEHEAIVPRDLWDISSMPSLPRNAPTTSRTLDMFQLKRIML